MLVQILKEIPDDVFNPVCQEVLAINWDAVPDDEDGRSQTPGFLTSKAICLRIPCKDVRDSKTLLEWSSNLDIIDNPKYTNQYVETHKIANWVAAQLPTLQFGRLMIIRLAPKSRVALHVDPFLYFETYSRYHIPVKTNELIIFAGEDVSKGEHMPYKYLCRLNNRLPHQVINYSDEPRIHIIVDIEVEGQNQIF